MVDPVAASRFAYRCLFVGLAAAIIFARLLPLNATPSQLPGPDLILCLALVWIQRRPDYLPAFLVVVVFFVDDILSMRPPGLWTLIVLLGTEFMRSRETTLRDIPFLIEWAISSAMIAAIAVAHWLVLSLFVVPQPGFGAIVLRILTTAIAYPAVVVATLLAFGVRKTAKGEVDALGHRL